MGGAPTAQDGLSGALSSALSPKKAKNNRDDNWGRRLVGHPRLFSYTFSHAGATYTKKREREQREKERERRRLRKQNRTTKKQQELEPAVV